MKKIVTFLLALMMPLSLAACGESGETPSPNDEKDKATEPVGDSGKDDKAQVIEPDEDGIAIGYEGDVLRTEFFDMSINNPYTCDEFDGLTPDEGRKFLVVELTLYNYTGYVQPMMDIDFEVIWDLDDDDAWAWPESSETTDANGETEYSVKSEKQLPVEYDLGIHKTETGILLYQVPEDAKEFFLGFYEVYAPEEGSDEPDYGDSFYIRFSA